MTTSDSTQPAFDLAAFRAKRYEAQKQGNQWDATVYEIKEAYSAGERNLHGVNLDGANLSGASLEGVNLSRASLCGANLSGASLSRASLDGANLGGANLGGANLSGVNLDGASLYGASLYCASLYCASLSRANLDCANLDGASLSRANLDGVSLDGASLYGVNLDGVNLHGVNLSGVDLDGVNLSGVNLLNAAGIYTAFTPFLSSRRAALLGGIVLVEDQIELRFWAGCKQSKTASELLKYVKETHGGDIHAKQYEAAVAFMETCFKADMAEGRWDYLLTWKTPETQKANTHEDYTFTNNTYPSVDLTPYLEEKHL